MSFAIIILNHKTSKLVRSLMTVLVESCGISGQQVYLIDNSLDKNESLVLEELALSFNLNLNILDSNNGYSAGNNTGIEMAIRNGFFHFFVINPDIMPHGNIFAGMHLKYQDTEPGFCVGPIVFNPFIGVNENPLNQPDYFRSLFGLSRKHNGEGNLLAGSFLYFDKTYWEKVGGFPEEVFMYNEEVILFLRSRNLNVSTIYDSTFKIWHNHEKSFRGLEREWRRKKVQLESSVHVMRKYLHYSLLTIALYRILFSVRLVFVFVYKKVRFGS